MSSRKRKTSKRSGILEIILCVAVMFAVVGPGRVEAEESRADRSAGQAAESRTLRLVSAEPTVLFVRGQEGLLQIARVTIENAAEPVRGRLEMKLDGKQRSIDVGLVNEGKTTVECRFQI